MTYASEVPLSVAKALAGLRGGVALLSCADTDKWNSLGRPSIADLSSLAEILAHNLEAAISEIAPLPDL